MSTRQNANQHPSGESGLRPGFRSRVLLVDDHPLMREALRESIDRQNDLVTCGEASDAASAMGALESSHPNLVLLDLTLGEDSGLDLLKRMLVADSSVRVLVLSMHDDTLYAERAIRAGAKGYINKRESSATIVSAIRTILKGDIYVNSKVMGRVLHRLTGRKAETAGVVEEQLSDREMETFELIGAGMGSREIAQRLHVSVKTVEAYRERIKAKLGLSSSPELARRAVEWVLRGR
jgi:DNA-binding NarL/FixJ family response regulator